jgi:hypothetical protein
MDMKKLKKKNTYVSCQYKKKFRHVHNFLKSIGNILKYFSVRRHFLRVKGDATAIVPASHLIKTVFRAFSVAHFRAYEFVDLYIRVIKQSALYSSTMTRDQSTHI